MFIKIKNPPGTTNPPDPCAVGYGVIVLLISTVIMSFNDQIENCRKTIFSLSSTNITPNNSSLQCNIPYEECRCSVISNKSNNAIECITDIQAMTAHISPLVSYVLQLYIIYELFLFKGKYSHILTNIFWVIVLFVFIIIAIAAHGSTCLYNNTSVTLTASGYLLLVIAFGLYVRSNMKYSSLGRGKIYRKRRLVKNNNKCEILTIVIVPWLWHYSVVSLHSLFCTLCDLHSFFAVY